MGSIGNWYLRSVPANLGEEVVVSFSANYLRNQQRPLGGKVYVTNYRLIFTPHLIDAWLAGDQYIRDLDEILSVERVDPNTPDSYGGGTEPRIRIVDAGEEDAFFIVNDLNRAVERIDTAVAEAISAS